HQLAVQGIHVDGNHSYPSENFQGPVTNIRLGSMLAYAAWAERWPAPQGLPARRAIRVNPLPELNPRQSAVQVLVGNLAPNSMAGHPRVHINTTGGAWTPLVLSAVAGLPSARQASAVLPPGPIRVGVEMDD